MRTLIELLVQHGVLLVFLVTLAARVGAPVPAAPLLVVAGGLAAAGQLSGAWSFIVAVLANLLGDGVWYQAGRRFGHRVMRLLCRVSLSPDSCVRQSESLIERWGGSALLAAKFLPGISVVAAPMAGALGMPLARFIGFDLIAGALWSGVFLALGLLLSTQIQQVLDMLAGAGLLAGLALLLIVIGLVLRRWWQRRQFMRALEMPRISVDEAIALVEQGQEPVFIDVRAAASRAADPRRIPGARLAEPQRIAEQARSLPRDRELVLYCNCPNEASAALAAKALAQLGFTRARALSGGLDGWEAAGRPVALA
ncbi:VTT domain-containing protein [Roseateles violae]|uniref:VTT domain-containing protein n=1 Tax=Roseateles violae TaxID=3058042 RepID=A0ABT8DWK3_9BURK|nr:VTT domain-containing protein [Pelomonas sp. PFR6]MDN3922506.1 VTT domain-containing protein [Pelomonas sp. PFR6]